MVIRIQTLLLSGCLFGLVACNQPQVTMLTPQQITLLSDSQIEQLSAQNCAKQDQYEVMTSRSHVFQKRLDRLTKQWLNTVNGKTLNYRVYLNTQPNAWASFNGCIRLTSGLMNLLTDDEIQAVIVHEIGHIALNHTLAAFRQAKSAEIHSNGTIILIMPQALSLQQEFAADDYAVRVLQYQQRDPYALITMLNKLDRHQQQASSSHPNTAARKTNLLKKIMR